MMIKYKNWLNEQYVKSDSKIDTSLISNMANQFKELSIVRGVILHPMIDEGCLNDQFKGLEREWLTDGKEIIDPISKLYPQPISYMKEIGLCAECKDAIYENQCVMHSFCSKGCEEKYFK